MRIPVDAQEPGRSPLPPYLSKEQFEQSTGTPALSPTSSAKPIQEKQPLNTVHEVNHDANLTPTTTASPIWTSDCGLMRGLQVPSRTSYMTSGFKYPVVLNGVTVSKAAWAAFTSEIKQHSGMSSSQWITTVGGAFGTFVVGNILIGFFGIVPAVIVGHKMRKHREDQNLELAMETGSLSRCVARWNESYFGPRGLLVRLELPGQCSDIGDMDVSTGPAYRALLERAASSPPTQTVPPYTKLARRQIKCDIKEDRKRMKAALRGRIVIVPLEKDAGKLASVGDPLLQSDGAVEKKTSGEEKAGTVGEVTTADP